MRLYCTVALLVCAALLACSVAGAATLTNLLVNPSMDGGFTNGAANGWTSYKILGLNASIGFAQGTSVHDGTTSQRIDVNTPYDPSTYTYAGLYQTVDATVGKNYMFTGWMYLGGPTQYSYCAPRCELGLDPTGGTDPLGSTVIYSDLNWNCNNVSTSLNQWKQYMVCAKATSTHVTVFFRITIRQKGQDVNAASYLDQAALIQFDNSALPDLNNNQGFENTDSIWSFASDAIPTNWTPYGQGFGNSGSTGAIFQSATTPVNSGSRSLKMMVATGSGKPGVFQRVATSPGTTCNIEVWAYGDRGGSGATLTKKLGVDPTGGTDPAAATVQWVTDTAAYGSWVKLQKTGLVAQSTSMTVFLGMDFQDFANTASCCFDSVWVRTSPDSTPPATISDLRQLDVMTDAAKIAWTSVGDDGMVSNAVDYQVRYSTQPITEANWSQATLNVGAPDPVTPGAGTSQYAFVRPLSPGTTYYIAVKARDQAGNWSSVSNVLPVTTLAPGGVPFWAYRLRDAQHSLRQIAHDDIAQNQSPAGDFGAGDMLEHQVGLLCSYGQLCLISPDTYIWNSMNKLAVYDWNHMINGWCKYINEAHHGPEQMMNNGPFVVLDYGNLTYVNWCVAAANQLPIVTGITPTNNPNGHRHFKSYWFDPYGNADLTLNRDVDNAQNSAYLMSMWYAVYANPDILLNNGTRVKDMLLQMGDAIAEDCMSTDLGKPQGLCPGEIKYSNHTIGAYSGQWWRQNADFRGSGWWYDWRVGFVDTRFLYIHLIQCYQVSGNPKYIEPVNKMLDYFFNQTNAQQWVGDQPACFFGDQTYPNTWQWNGLWDDRTGVNTYLGEVAILWRQVTGDNRYDDKFARWGTKLKSLLRHEVWGNGGSVTRSTGQWDTEPTAPSLMTPPFYLAWQATGDKDYIRVAADMLARTPNGADRDMMQYSMMYLGGPGISLATYPYMAVSYENINDNFAALVLNSDKTHIKLLIINLDSQAQTPTLRLWCLGNGNYLLRRGPDANADDKPDYTAEAKDLIGAGLRSTVSITLPPGAMQVVDISPRAVESLADVKDAFSRSDDKEITLPSSLVSGVFSGCFYIQSDDRTRGIRIDWSGPVTEGTRKTVTGMLTTINGERRIVATSVM